MTVEEVKAVAKEISEIKKQSLEEELLEVAANRIDDIRSKIDILEDANWGTMVLDEIPGTWSTMIDELIEELNALKLEGMDAIGAT